MLVGEVRLATTPRGSSWKLSGGRWLCSAVTKVSKKRQVRRATRRSSRCCAGSSSERAADGDRQQHAAEHALVEAREGIARGAQQVGGDPFQQVTVTHEHAPQRASD